MTSLNLAICSTSRTSCEKVKLNTAVNCQCYLPFDSRDGIPFPSTASPVTCLFHFKRGEAVSPKHKKKKVRGG